MIGCVSLFYYDSQNNQALYKTTTGSHYKTSDLRLKFTISLMMVVAWVANTPFSVANASEDINHPGGIAILEIPKKSEELPTVRYGLTEPAILSQENTWQILIGLDINQLPGEYLLYTRQAGDAESAYFLKFQVSHKSYPIVQVPAEELIELPNYEQLSELDFSNSQPPGLPMRLPFEGDWNNGFGQLFLVHQNQKMLAQNHTWGAVKPSSLVRSPQAGIIAKIVTNDVGVSSLVLDHGRGIYSVLHGLDNLAVELGNSVVAGAVLGKVPEQKTTSSRAKKTNDSEIRPKVYWQVQLNGVFVNPLLMTQL